MVTLCDDEWQLTKKTVLERSCHMFNNPFISDITFTCGESDRKFYAHKYVLATSSPVFYAMFYGELAKKNSVIHLHDTDEETFEEFLRFLYTDQYSDASGIAVKMLYLAKKYMIPPLTQKCVDIIQNSIEPDNVVAVLEQAIHFDEKRLEEKCWAVIDSQTYKVMTSEAFYTDISRKTLVCLLRRNTLNIPEVELFKAVLRWSDRQCLMNSLEISGENRRATLGDAVYQIRFLPMTQKEFAQYVSSSGVLNNGELVPIYEKFSGIENPDLKWKQTKRHHHLKSLARFRSADVGGKWGYGNTPDRISFRVNRPAIFHGVRLFVDDNGSKYDVSLELNGAKVSGTYVSELDNEGIYGYNVMLPTPVTVDENKVVTTVAAIKGPSSVYGENGKASVEVDEITITFSAVSEPSNGTNVSHGQFYQIILSTTA